jgi:hypothetical protein
VRLDDPHLAAKLLAVSARIHSELGIPQESDVAETQALLEGSVEASRLAELVAAAGTLGDDDAVRLAIEASARFDTDSATR